MIQRICVYVAVAAFVVLAANQCYHGDWRKGIASALLAIINGLLLS